MEEWELTKARFPIGKRIAGKVVRRELFGVFVELEDGVIAFIDVINLSDGKMNWPDDYPAVGETVEGTVLSHGERAQQIRLTLRSYDNWADYIRTAQSKTCKRRNP